LLCCTRNFGNTTNVKLKRKQRTEKMILSDLECSLSTKIDSNSYITLQSQYKGGQVGIIKSIWRTSGLQELYGTCDLGWRRRAPTLRSRTITHNLLRSRPYPLSKWQSSWSLVTDNVDGILCLSRRLFAWIRRRLLRNDCRTSARATVLTDNAKKNSYHQIAVIKIVIRKCWWSNLLLQS